MYLFIKGKLPSLLWLWFKPGAVRFAGSENMIRSIVQVVETCKSKNNCDCTYGTVSYVPNTYCVKDTINFREGNC